MPRMNIVVALGNELQKCGVERMLQSLTLIGELYVHPDLDDAVPIINTGRADVVLAASRELDDFSPAAWWAVADQGVKVLLLVDDEDLTDLGRLVRVRCGGFLCTSDLSSSTLSETLRRMHNGEVPIPPLLARSLLAAIEEGVELPRDRSSVRMTPREQETLVLLVEGLSNKQIANRLGITTHGAKRLVANILAKLDCSNRTLAVAKVLREGIYARYVQRV